MKFSIKDFFIKCDQLRIFLRIWLHLLKKSLMENFIFCAVPDAIFLHYSCILALHRQLTKTLNQFLKLSKASKYLEMCMSVLFEQLNESSQI